MSLRPRALLIIEHDASVRQLYSRSLRTPYEIVEAQTVSECERAFETHDIVTVIIEPHRPDGCGETLLTTIRQLCAARQTPITVCSVLDAQHETRHTGIHKYLVKPVAPERLRNEVLRMSTRPDSSSTHSSPA
jgi:DNA-binding response OmpR family regulator